MLFAYQIQNPHERTVLRVSHAGFFLRFDLLFGRARLRIGHGFGDTPAGIRAIAWDPGKKPPGFRVNGFFNPPCRKYFLFLAQEDGVAAIYLPVQLVTGFLHGFATPQVPPGNAGGKAGPVAGEGEDFLFLPPVKPGQYPLSTGRKETRLAAI